MCCPFCLSVIRRLWASPGSRQRRPRSPPAPGPAASATCAAPLISRLWFVLLFFYYYDFLCIYLFSCLCLCIYVVAFGDMCRSCYLSNTASFAFYGITCLTRLIELAAWFATLEESARYTQVVLDKHCFPRANTTNNNMYVCMHVCMHACMHVCMYACTYACMHLCIYVTRTYSGTLQHDTLRYDNIRYNDAEQDCTVRYHILLHILSYRIVMRHCRIVLHRHGTHIIIDVEHILIRSHITR